MNAYETFDVDDLKQVYRVLHSQLPHHVELIVSDFLDGLQSHLQAVAAAEGVDGCDHAAWDAWLGGEAVSCDVRMEKRFVISPDSGEEKRST